MVKIVKCALAAVLASLPAAAFAAWELNMPVGVTELSRRIHALHMLILWVCVVIAIAVFGVMIYSIVKFRKSKGAEPDKTRVHSTKVEIVWTVIPIMILIGMAVPIAGTPDTIAVIVLDRGDWAVVLRMTPVGGGLA